MTVVEHVAGTQIVLRGQVSDSLTGLGIAASLALDFDQGAGFRPLPFPLRRQSGGLFAVAARLGEISGRMQLGKAVTLRLTATAPGYQTATLTQALTAAQFARKPDTIMVGGVAVPVQTVAAAPIILKLVLKPRPVMLAGMVVSDHQLSAPVPGAEVQITGPGGTLVTTDITGRFRFDAPPLALSLPLKVTLGTRTAQAVHLTDFATPVNFVTLNLPTI